MKDLRIKILLFITTIIIFLIVYLIGYIYNINVFKKQLNVLERSHDFIEDVLELRRYEKNFVYKIDVQDLDEVLIYIKRIKSEVKNIMYEHKLGDYSTKIKKFNRDITTYEKLIKKAKYKKKVNLKEIRKYGHNILILAQTLLELNKKYVNRTIDKILFLPSIVMFLFGGILIIFLAILTFTILKQISFIQKTTERILKGDFSYIPQNDTASSYFGIIINAFNKMIRELEKRQEDLLQAKKLSAVGTLVSGIAHELNNPLNNISITAESMLEEWNELEKKEAQEMLKEILEEARRASFLVKDLLDFSRKKKTHIRELIDIKDIIDSSIKLTKNQLMISDIKLIKDIPEDLPKVYGNADNLKQVFINLFSNAIQAMPKGGSLKISARKNPNGYIEITVQDSGLGMPPDVLERIFDPFFSTKPIGEGTGLGLSIVYSIVKKHGGYIEVKSRQGEGTTFRVYLPIASSDSITK